MIDFHNHVLPNVDDGSTSLEMSLSMLKHAAEQGITDVVNTVHFQHPKVEGEDISFSRISTKVMELQAELDENQIPIKLHSSAEVFYLPNLTKLVENKLVTFGQGKYLLIEFQPHLIPESHKQQLFDLKMMGVTPIIAHPERYKPVQQNLSIVSTWLEAGCLIQIDAGSVLGFLGTNAEITSMNILKQGWCQLMGSDAHDNRQRNFCLKDATDKLNELDIQYLDEMVNINPRKILNGESISVDINYDKLLGSSTIFSRIKDKIGLS